MFSMLWSCYSSFCSHESSCGGLVKKTETVVLLVIIIDFDNAYFVSDSDVNINIYDKI